MIIAVDFDGTCVTHEYPRIGREIGAVGPLKRLAARGDKLILWTMRSGETLERAVAWFRDNHIPLWAVNDHPGQESWTESRKVYAHRYIDDAAVGCPLLPGLPGERPYVDWDKMALLLGVPG